VELLDALDAAHADADDDADAIGLGGGIFSPTGPSAIWAAADRVLDERVHLLDLAPFDAILGREVADLAGDLVGKSSVAKRVIGAMPERPAMSAVQFFSTPVPRGVTRPTPVTTTRRAPFCARSSTSRGHARKGGIEESSCGRNAAREPIERRTSIDVGLRPRLVEGDLTLVAATRS
jgi:hypothetical protein